MEAYEITSRMIDKYANASSYSDKGYMHSVNEGEEKPDRPYIIFQTQFKSPNKFLFNWKDHFFDDSPWREHQIGSDGRKSFKAYAESAIELEENLDMAIAGAYGVSRGTVGEVSELFLAPSEAHSNWRNSYADVELIGQEQVETQNCYCISATSQRPKDTTLWIAVSDLRLVRVKTNKVITPSESQETRMMALEVLKDSGIDTSEFRRLTDRFSTFSKERRYYSEITYREWNFDQEISDSVFSIPS